MLISKNPVLASRAAGKPDMQARDVLHSPAFPVLSHRRFSATQLDEMEARTI